MIALVWSTPSSRWTHQDLTKSSLRNRWLVKGCLTVSMVSGNTVLCVGHLHRHSCSRWAWWPWPWVRLYSTTPLCMLNLWSCHQQRWAGQTQASSACSSLLFCPAVFFLFDLSVCDCTSCPGLHTLLHTKFEASHSSVVSHMLNSQVFNLSYTSQLPKL